MDVTAWHDFFVATASAAAALTGLIFVGVSINITKILSFPKLPARALLSLILLMTILVISSLMLVPDQSHTAITLEVALIAVTVYVIVTTMDAGIYKGTDRIYQQQYVKSIVFNQVSLLPYIVCAISLLAVQEHGLYWLVPAIAFSFIKAVVDAWVLLVEINR